MGEPLVVVGVYPSLAEHAGTRVRLRAALHATPSDAAVLWSEALGAQPVGPGGQVHLVLGAGADLGADVFARYPRWLAVVAEGAPERDPRLPLTGAALRHGERLAQLGTARAGLDDEARRMLARMPSRLRTLTEGFEDVHVRLAALEDAEAATRAEAALDARIDAAEVRLRRTEDQVEDLVGPPHGEVVALGRRVAALEAQVGALSAALARLAEALPGASGDA